MPHSPGNGNESAEGAIVSIVTRSRGHSGAEDLWHVPRSRSGCRRSCLSSCRSSERSWLLATRLDYIDRWLMRSCGTAQQKVTSTKQNQDAAVINLKLTPSALKKTNIRDSVWILIETWQHVKNTRSVEYAAITYEQ